MAEGDFQLLNKGFTVPAVHSTIQQTSPSGDSHPYIELTPTATGPIAALGFQNRGSAMVSIFAQVRQHSASSTKGSEWRVVCSRLQLMRDPHCDDDAEDFHVISLSHGSQVITVRIVMMQLSPHYPPGSFGVAAATLFSRGSPQELLRAMSTSRKALDRASLPASSAAAAASAVDERTASATAAVAVYASERVREAHKRHEEAVRGMRPAVDALADDGGKGAWQGGGPTGGGPVGRYRELLEWAAGNGAGARELASSGL
ncbi:unnamed protein product [Pedinophyceae sp. YPF-701]|nr:unnamed protein product [Pedinophyceae sp. YPF-701]